MILTCPECSARYVVDPTALLPDGRRVRCAKCKHSWKEPAPHVDTPMVDAAEAESPAVQETAQPKQKEPEVKAPVAPETSETPETPESAEEEFAIRRNRRKKRPRPIPKGSNLPALQGHKHGDSLWGWYSLGGFVVLIIASFLIFQTSISEIWPPSQKLYRALGLDNHGASTGEHAVKEEKVPYHELFKIENTVPGKTRVGKLVTLTVKGNIRNLTDETLPLPLLKITLKNNRGKTVREWTFKPATATISEGQKVPYSTSLPNPPDDATSISVTFADQ